MSARSEQQARTSVKGNAIRAGFVSIAAPFVARFLTETSGDDVTTMKVMGWIAVGLVLFGFGSALYAVFGIAKHRSPLALVLGLVGGTITGMLLMGILRVAREHLF